jgi:uncharacterized protein YjbI with pentapeptide repeats
MKDVLFSESNFTYSNFGHSKLQKMIFSSSDFSNAYLAECKLKEMEINDVSFNGCDFFKTPLRGIDLRNSRIDGLLISDGFKELEGVTVDLYQAAGLARFLGVNIK